MIPTTGQRKVRVNLGDQHDEDGFVEGSKSIDMVVEGQSVYIVSATIRRFQSTCSENSFIQLDDDGTLHAIDSSTATPPSLGNTWFIALMKHVFRKFISKNDKLDEVDQPYEADATENGESDDVSSTTSEATRSGTSTPREDTGKSGSIGARGAPVEKAGGKRRKVNKRR